MGIGGLPANISEFRSSLENSSSTSNFAGLFIAYAIYLLIVAVIVLVQDSYKRINIVSARQLTFNFTQQEQQNSELKRTYIPIKLNQGGIMPLVFSSTVAALIFYPAQLFISSKLGNILPFVPTALTFFSFAL